MGHGEHRILEPVTKSRWLRLLHLLWALPVAAAIQVPVAFATRLSWCGVFTGCTNFGSRTDIPHVGETLGILLLDAVVTAGVLVLAPWITPFRLRLWIAIAIGVAIAVFWLLNVTAFPHLLWR